MQLYSECMICIIRHHWSLIKDHPDEARKDAFMRDMFRTLAEANPNEAAPVPTAKLQKLCQAGFDGREAYRSLKHRYDQFMLDRMPVWRARLETAEDAFKAAVWLAMVGNYIDFGIIHELDEVRLQQMLDTPDEKALGTPELARLRAEVHAAKRLAYVCDNCGEVVLDMLLMGQMQKENPSLEITALVRGEDVLNDVTVEDAHRVGLDSIVRVVGNGTNIGGTQLAYLSSEAREALLNADVVVAKGQGNFETLTGTGLNVYYLFLAKCPHYTKWFGMGHMTGQLVHERRFSAHAAQGGGGGA